MGIPPHRHRRAFLPEVEEVSARLLDTSARDYEQLRTCPHCHWSEQLAPDVPRWRCRRWPPVVNPNRPGESMFPMVGEKDWCGEHQQ